jgi:hypothetical protein
MENDKQIVYVALEGAQELIEAGYSPYQIGTVFCFDTRDTAFASFKQDPNNASLEQELDNLKIVCSIQIPSDEIYPDKNMPQAIGKCALCVDDILQVYTLCTMSLTRRESLVNTTRLTPAQYRELLRMTREEPSADLGSIVAKASLQAIYSNINPLIQGVSDPATTRG